MLFRSIIVSQSRYVGEIGREEYFTLSEELQKVGLLERTDLAQLHAYCAAVETMHIAARNRNNDAKDFRLWSEAVDKILRLAAKFGFDPASRTKVAMGKPKEEVTKDPFEQALEGSKMKVAK